MRVGIERHVAGLIVCKSGWQRTAILAAAHLVQDPSPQPGFDDMKFGLAHCSLEAKQKPVVEAGWIVDAVFIEDQRIGQSAISSRRCQSALFLARRDTSSPMTMPTRPMPVSLTRR